ncbi:sensor domain-containing diguanylate cyclase [Kaarinaea lacus]
MKASELSNGNAVPATDSLAVNEPDPIDEAIRLKNLHSLNLLDTPAEERFDRLTRLAKSFFDVPMALVQLVDKHRVWSKSGIDDAERDIPRQISMCTQAINNNSDVLVINDATKDKRFADMPYVKGEPRIRFYAGCPLRYLDGSKMGTFCILDTKPRTLSDEEIEHLKSLAEIAQRELIVTQLATLDDLTGIANRRGFIALAQKSLQLCHRQDIPASLVFFDINKFKSINDNYGHAEGDRALIAFAQQMRYTFRESDVFARLGGDEFVVLLTNTTIVHGEELIQRFRAAVDAYNRKAKRGYKISFSSGIVSVDTDHPQSINTLLDRADSVMYQQKHGSPLC